MPLHVYIDMDLTLLAQVEAGDVNQFVDAIMLGTRFPPSLGKSPKSKKVVIANVTNINMSQLQFADPKVRGKVRNGVLR